MDDLHADALRMARAELSVDNLVDMLVERVADWLSPPKRMRLVARFELFMMASRDPDLATIVTQQRQQFLQATEAALRKAGVPKPTKVASMVLVTVDAILLDHIRANGPALAQAQQKVMFRKVLE